MTQVTFLMLTTFIFSFQPGSTFVRVSPGQQRLTRHPWSGGVVEHGVRTAVLCDTTVICRGS